MREVLFRKSRQAFWDQVKNQDIHNPDELADAFMEISQDLSYAKTFYPQSDLVPYLNTIATDFYSKLYKNKKSERGGFIKFWIYDLPSVLYNQRRWILYSFLFFSLCCLIGAVAAAKNPAFIETILGKGYINTTNENISKGDPFGIYKSMEPVPMFLMIMVNNIYVSFRIFVYGIFLGGGTLMNLFQNGIMLGSFQYYFFSKNLGWSSVLVIWIHGTLEISAIILSGCAGLILGKSIVFPGTFSRLESLKKAALDGIKIIISLVPVFIMAAFLEGFITRHDHMPKVLSIFILLISLLFVLFYYIYYPYSLFNSKSIKPKTKSHE